MELMFQHPDVRRQWFQTYARSVRRHHFEAAPKRAPSVLVLLHESPATRNLAHKLIQRLRGLGEEICVLSDADTWRSMPDMRFRSLFDGDRPLDMTEIRRQIAEWHQAKRVVFDVFGHSGPREDRAVDGRRSHLGLRATQRDSVGAPAVTIAGRDGARLA